MKVLVKNFINGILTIVPVILVVYVIYKAFMFLDGLLGNLLKNYLEDSYVPGIGLLLTLVLITLLGWLSTKFVTGKLYRMIDNLLERIPLVKTLYSVTKDTINSFLGDKKSFSTVVLISQPNSNMKSIGFLTSDSLGDFYKPLSDSVAVYIPQTFQVAGFTVLVPKSSLEIIDVKPEDAMKFVLSGGMGMTSK
ncbi:hypothetical protein CVD28_03505 [Bacillus sp. M6-12]|uniref:DUF502 domain-containing protein n=1 Tax=Bacillus sp. M6-12 TaxID=2054166 RepID=UPI000C76D7DA|nr:DUF502 domain-containing protein [Bacillus sp. M6-12]PLS19495.1 hypothetical protein CVD28_03505 [Bacillus sp. M6-12]